MHLFSKMLNTIEMSKRDISEALYALPDVKIIRRRKPLLVPVVLLIAGLALFAVNAFVESSVEMSNLKSALVLIAVVLVIVGGIMLLIRVSGGDNIPYHETDKCYLKKEELRFDKDKRNYIQALVDKSDFTTLRSLKQDGVSAVTVMLYTSPKSGFCAAQAFEYVELERRAIGAMTYTTGH